MSWYATSWQHMEGVRCASAGKSPAEIAKGIDNSYPYSEKSGWAYKAWLQARREFFRRHSLPLRRARKPLPDLLADLEA